MKRINEHQKKAIYDSTEKMIKKIKRSVRKPDSLLRRKCTWSEYWSNICLQESSGNGCRVTERKRRKEEKKDLREKKKEESECMKS